MCMSRVLAMLHGLLPKGYLQVDGQVGALRGAHRKVFGASHVEAWNGRQLAWLAMLLSQH